MLIPVIIGLDISTACTGIVVTHAETGDLILMQHENMASKVKFPDFWSKVMHMRETFAAMHDKSWDVKIVAIEENAKRFTPGFSSADTILTLAKFNGILCYLMLEEYLMTPTYINVRSARSKLGIKINYKDKSMTTKQKVLKHVVDLHPDFPWVYREVKGKTSLTKINEDRCDAWVIAEAARIMTA
jgi:hypothetical protein